MRCAFGLPSLDEMIGGGLPTGTVTVLSAPTLAGKRSLAHAFLLDGLARREGGLLVVTDRPVPRVRDALAAIDGHLDAYESEGTLRYVAATPTPLDPLDAPATTEIVDAPWDLNALTASIDRAMQPLAPAPGRRVAVETLTELLNRGSPERALRFLRVALDRIRDADGTTIALVDAGVHPRGTTEQLETLTDAWLELRRKGSTLEARAFGDALDGPREWTRVCPVEDLPASPARLAGGNSAETA